MSEGGAAAALATHDGPLSGVSRALATAASSGAPAIATLQAYLDVESHRRHAAAVEAARKLPVRMLVPLTLLVLPGFVLVTVAPLVIDSLARLDL
jgi:pilus assembly protein TadC